MADRQPTVSIAARASVSIDSVEYDVLYFDPAPTVSVDTVEVKTVGAAKTVYLPGAIKNAASVEVKILKPTSGTLPAEGDLCDLKITVSSSVNGEAASAGESYTIPCFIQQIAPDRIEGDGATRQETIALTLQPTQLEANEP